MTGHLWIYKNNSKPDPGRSYGDWEEFFATSGPQWWGTTAHIGINNRDTTFDMEPGDQVLCWQTNRRRAVGLALIAELPEFEGDSGYIERDFVLEPLERFDPAVPLLDLRRTNPALKAIQAFRKGFVKTIYRTTDAEAAALLAACGTSGAPAARSRKAQRANAESERAAVRHVTRAFRADGWDVTSVERDKIGYDLHASRGTQVLHLEVKGTVGNAPNFFLTANEHRRASDDPKWHLCLVLNALDAKKRNMHTWTGAELLEQGTFVSASFRVAMEDLS
ncbi:MAG: DUF3883 domain-containing protein [Acidimicrobiales bacterium]